MEAAPPLSVAKPLFSVALLLGLASAVSAQTAEWIFHKTADGTHPNGNEQQMVWLMNRARSNPAQEGVFLANTGDAWVNLGIQDFQVNVPLMQSEFAALSPRPPAAFDRRLYEGSRAHSLDMIARNTQDHNGQTARNTAAGFSSAGGVIAIYAYSETVLNAHGALNIDWGSGPGGMQANRPHRAGLTGSFGNVGVALVATAGHFPNTGPLVMSGSYLTANTTVPNHFNQFLVGTVWIDGNSNNRYDPGEGVNNVLVQPDSGPWHAITGVAGGWAFPVTTAATYNLTLSGGSLPSPINRTAVVGAVSVLVDVKVNLSATPFRLDVAKETNGNLLLSWSGGTGPFQVQRSTTLAAQSWQNVGGSTAGRSLSVTPSGPRTYYRVLGSE